MKLLPRLLLAACLCSSPALAADPYQDHIAALTQKERDLAPFISRNIAACVPLSPTHEAAHLFGASLAQAVLAPILADLKRGGIDAEGAKPIAAEVKEMFVHTYASINDGNVKAKAGGKSCSDSTDDLVSAVGQIVDWVNSQPKRESA